MANLFKLFQNLIPNPPLLVGVVTSVETGGCVIQLPDGSTVFGRGTAAVDDHVFVRDGVIEGQAPALTVETIEV